MTTTFVLAASIAIAIPLSLSSLPAHAAPTWSIGVDVHGTDNAFATNRPLGVALGLRAGSLEGSLVADPSVLVDGWEMFDATLGGWIAGDRIELLAGWRNISGPTHGGRRYDENVLLGADIVAMSARHFRLEFGAELQTSVWRHGAHIPDDTAAFAFDADLATRTELMLHLRFKLTGD